MKRSTRAILLVLVIFVLLVALNFLFFVDTQQAQETEQTGNRSSYRTTPYGTRAFYTLLEETGYPVTRLEKPYNEITDRDDIGTLVLIALPDNSGPNKEEFDALAEWVGQGKQLLIIDQTVQLDHVLGDLVANTTYAMPNVEPKPLQPTHYAFGVERVKTGTAASRLRLSGHGTVYHFGDEQGALLADARVKEGRIIFLTDPHIVANNGIKEADNVMLALNLFSERPAGKIAFDEYHHGYGAHATSEGVLAYFRGTPVPWLFWQGVLIAAVAVYTVGRRFARPLPLRRERRTTNLEFVSSMATITRMARATDLAMQNVYWDFRKRLCRYSGLPSNADSAKLAASAARRAHLDEAELARLLTVCDQVSRGRPVSDAELLRLVTRIRDIESQLGI
ncbi:MAG TPA: DUF4350 domain-containing protein [Blastocatellia bacterium]|nr:DUF4350 domain-containing protein [Blastocatellia bacterium]